MKAAGHRKFGASDIVLLILVSSIGHKFNVDGLSKAQAER